jgi:Flp pilus assembly protein TadD
MTITQDPSLPRHVSAAFALAIVLAGSCGIAGCATAPEKPTEEPPVISALGVTSPDDARKQAAEAQAKGNTDLALRLYVDAAEHDPTDAASFYQIGTIYEQRHDASLAARAYARAIQLDPTHAEALENLGLIYFENRQLEEAMPMLQRSLEAKPTQWRSHNALGLIADGRADYATANAHFDAALTIRPRSALLLNNRGYSKYLSGDLEAAELDYRAALSADPAYKQAWQNLGLVFARQGRYEQAMATVGRVVSNYVAANDVGYIAMLSGDYSAAERLFQEAIRLSPRYYGTANENLAELRRRRSGSATAQVLEETTAGP